MNLPGFTAGASLGRINVRRQIDAQATDLHRGRGSVIRWQSDNSVCLSAMGEDFPGTTCTWKGCASGGAI